MRIHAWLLGLLLIATANAAEPPTPAEAREIARDAWIYSFPLYEMLRTRWNAIENPENPRRYPANTFGHARRLADHASRTVTTPNNDTIYSSAWLDLADGPVTLSLPDVSDRYWSIAFMDTYTNNFAYLGTRATQGRGGRFVITGPGWQGEAPAGATVIHAPTNLVWALGRILVDSEADLANVARIQAAMVLQGGRSAAQPKPKPSIEDAAAYVATVNRGMADNPPPAAPILARIGRIGIGPGLGGPPPELVAAVGQGFADGRAAIRNAGNPGTVIDGWSYPPPHLGNFGDDYLLRAVVALNGLAALEPAEATYMRWIGDGKPLDGEHRHVLRFAPGQLPAVDGFWSLSLYEVMPDGRLFFADNPLRRYAIGDRTKGLQRTPDGGLEILVQHVREGTAPPANVLPAPRGPFALTLRAYLPQPALLRREAVLPALERLD